MQDVKHITYMNDIEDIKDMRNVQDMKDMQDIRDRSVVGASGAIILYTCQIYYP